MQEPLNQEEISFTKTKLEKRMMFINPDFNDRERRIYIAGCIDTLVDEQKISEETHEEIYPEYCF